MIKIWDLNLRPPIICPSPHVLYVRHKPAPLADHAKEQEACIVDGSGECYMVVRMSSG